MINDFQKAMLNNRDVAFEIVKVFHPDILEEYPHKYKKDKIINTKNILIIESKYDWIIIRVSPQKHLNVSIGIEFECNLYSGWKALVMFEKELAKNKFRAWRFADDSKSVRGIVPKDEADNYNIKVNEILTRYNISKPTALQMSDYYHS